MKFRKKPVVVDAIQWDGDLMNMRGFFEPFNDWWKRLDGCLIINTLEGKMCANKGDWIIKGITGEFYPCKNDIFEKTYEKVIE